MSTLELKTKESNIHIVTETIIYVLSSGIGYLQKIEDYGYKGTTSIKDACFFDSIKEANDFNIKYFSSNLKVLEYNITNK